MLRRTVLISLFVSWSILTAILLAGLVFRDRSVSSLAVDNIQTPLKNTITREESQLSNTGGTTPLTSEELARHNGSNDCWLLIDSKVYNVTEYLPRHPGGVFIITPFCGKDASIVFQTKNGEGAHSSRAWDLLHLYSLGDLNGTTTQERIDPTRQL
ncbi:MAG TPA: cytochrome b5-like heme/steroid binding domain-containing protein [Patescibacteria group bacterium]|nr:cytochrome b5-like heme/steroid binding domain-containing protein [Patescibacteria group bacterium]